MAGQRDRGGARLIDHVRRVAARVPRHARVVAWLHEALEHTSISEEELLADGLSVAELRALRLLTRDLDSRSDTIYLAHIERLARARGPGAEIARTVKRADLTDRMLHPSTAPADGHHHTSSGLRSCSAQPVSGTRRAGSALGRAVRPSLTSQEQRGLPGTEFELRAERLGTALRGLAAQLVDERRKVAELRRENRELKAQLERRQPTGRTNRRRSGRPPTLRGPAAWVTPRSRSR